MALLDKKLVLITGAGNGIGAALARGMAAEGARVIVADLDPAAGAAVAEEITKAGGEAVAKRLDVTDLAAAKTLAADIRKTLGPVDVVVNNAGVAFYAPIDADNAEDAWERTLSVNLDGVFNVTRAFVPQLKESRGNIVNVSSIAGFIRSRASFAYGTSKGAVRAMTTTLCAELAQYGIRVNAIAPGVVATPLEAREIAELGENHWFVLRAPFRRVAQPEEMVGPVVFLASDMARFVSGATLVVDGGFLCS